MKKAFVDQAKCIGCGACASLAAKSFKISEDGKSQPIDPAGDDEATIQSALEACPVQAISLKE